MSRLYRFLLTAFILAACAAPAPAPTAQATARLATSIPAIPTPTAARPTAAPVPVDTAAPAPAPTATPAQAAPNPADYGLRPLLSGLRAPVDLLSAPDGSGRLFIVEQPGRILVYQAGALLPEPFLDLRASVNNQGSEQGLLGLAFHPAYAANGQFFINYTRADGGTVIAGYTVSADPNRADPASGQTVLQFDQPYPNHNGGALAFGPDGYLYIASGDGGSAGDPHDNGQRLDTFLGKILRLNVDQLPYAIPPDNPFVGQTAARPEIWAYGLRNPWRFSFDRASGDLYIGDVGQNRYEEIDFQPAGAPGGVNYGWNFMEGLHAYQGQAPAGLTPPVLEYAHQTQCAVTGGYVYRGANLPGLTGFYLYGDYCSGQVWALYRDPAGAWLNTLLLETGLNISSFGQDAAGEVYVLDHRAGGVYQLAPAP